jgi:hypothetical protein
LPKIVEDEHLDLGLGGRVLGPVMHRFEALPERCEKALASLLEPLAIGLAKDRRSGVFEARGDDRSASCVRFPPIANVVVRSKAALHYPPRVVIMS